MCNIDLIESLETLTVKDSNYSNELNATILIQKNIRRFLNHQGSIPSYYQTKKWRQNQAWYKTDKFNECEKYQINFKYMDSLVSEQKGGL